MVSQTIFGVLLGRFQDLGQEEGGGFGVNLYRYSASLIGVLAV
jgi:hypothetical protein